MKLTKSEIKYLSTSFAPQTPLSIFANIDAQQKGDEYQTLTEKGVIVGNAYSQEALSMLFLLAKPDRAARFLAQMPNFIMEKYSYKSGDTLILAENNEGELEFSIINDTLTLSSRFSEAFGISAYGSSNFELVLTPAETAVFLTIVDLNRKRAIIEYAGQKVAPAVITTADIFAEFAADYKNGLSPMFLKNYRLTAPASSQISAVVDSLKSKGIVNDGPTIRLTEQYERFSSTFLVIETLAMYEAFGLQPDGQVATASRLAVKAGKNEVAAFFYDGENVQISAASPLDMIRNIEAFMSCPVFEKSSLPANAEPPQVQQPISQTAPAPAPAPAAAPASAPTPTHTPTHTPTPTPTHAPATASLHSEWTCTCGRVNTGNFCAGCGSRKP